MQAREDLRAGFISIKLDVITHGVCGEKTVDAAEREEFFANDLVEQLGSVFEEFTRLLAVLLVLKNCRIAPPQFPGVEEWRPVDEPGNLLESDRQGACGWSTGQHSCSS